MNDREQNETGIPPEGKGEGSAPKAATEAEERMRRDFKTLGPRIGFLPAAEALLKAPAGILYEVRHGRGRTVVPTLLATAVVCLSAYGLSVGMFSLGDQLWAAPLKITVGALLSALICFPSLVIFSYLGGSDSSIQEIFATLIASVSLASLLLLGFGPVSWVFSQSTDSTAFMGALHLAVWLIGLHYGLRFLSAASILLGGGRNLSLRVWAAVFLVVSLQMTTTLRPLVGTSEKFLQPEKKFFLNHWTEILERPY